MSERDNTIVFATNNVNKLEEVNSLIKDKITFLSLEDIGCNDVLPETHDTLEDNASEKACYVYKKYHSNCFAEDTGLEIEALNGEPGVYSARYAGSDKNAEANVRLVLDKLKGIDNRRAHFRTVLSLILEGKEYQFKGFVNGKILEDKRGEQGFGYDPIFQPDGYSQSFAEIGLDEKNKISHRSIAVKQLIKFLLKFVEK